MLASLCSCSPVSYVYMYVQVIGVHHSQLREMRHMYMYVYISTFSLDNNVLELGRGSSALFLLFF